MRQLHWSCLICSGIAENDEVVAVEDFLDVGNILGKSWLSLSGSKVITLPLHYMGNSNYLKLMVLNMHEYFRFWVFCKLHAILDKISKEKYDLPMQRKSLDLSSFANFGHQSMHQVLHGTLTETFWHWRKRPNQVSTVWCNLRENQSPQPDWSTVKVTNKFYNWPPRASIDFIRSTAKCRHKSWSQLIGGGQCNQGKVFIPDSL